MEGLDKLSGKRVLITGGAGLIGSHVVDLLTEAGASEIIVFDNLSRGSLDNLVQASTSGLLTFVEGDIRNRAAVSQALEGIDVLFHFAAIRLTQCIEEPRKAIEVMVNGTFNVMEAAVRLGVKKTVLASSSSIYGMAEHFPTREDHHPYNNLTIYGTAKIFGEGLLTSFRDMYSLDCLALRYFNVYGPRMDTHGAYTEVLIRWMERIEQGLPPLIFGDGLQTMDFVYVGDVARANIMAAASDLSGQVFNIGSGVETSLNELAEVLLGVMGSDLVPEHRPEQRSSTVLRRLADTRLAEERLGFKAETSLSEGLQQLVMWWRKPPRRGNGHSAEGTNC